MLYDPIVIQPPGFDQAKQWAKCNEAAKHVERPDGEVNWKAAFSADPGVCSCPACRRMHWAWGSVQRCSGCGFEYPTGWWSMYAWGVAAAKRGDTDRGVSRLHRERMSHLYYRYGYEHPVEDAWKEHDRIDWRTVTEAKS
jgi:hypothetical protein